MNTEWWFREYIFRFVEAINARDWEALDKLVDTYISDEYIAHLPGVSGTVRGPEGQKQWFRGVVGSIPGYHTTVEDFFAVGDKGAVRCKGCWTDPATGKAKYVTSMMIFHFNDDKAVEEWELVGEWEDES